MAWSCSGAPNGYESAVNIFRVLINSWKTAEKQISFYQKSLHSTIGSQALSPNCIQHFADSQSYTNAPLRRSELHGLYETRFFFITLVAKMLILVSFCNFYKTQRCPDTYRYAQIAFFIEITVRSWNWGGVREKEFFWWPCTKIRWADV